MNLNGNNHAVRKKQTRKVKKKLRRLQKAKKLKRYMVDAIRDVKLRKHANARKRAIDIEDDWCADRQIVAENEADDDILPLDMLDADIDWENSTFASKIRRIEEEKNDAEIDDIESKIRRFPGILDDNVRELLPIKVGTKVIRQTCKKDESNDESEYKEDNQEDEVSQIDLSQLSAAELLKLCYDHVEEAKSRISRLSHLIIEDPHTEVHKLKELYSLSIGNGVFSLARETVIKLASVSLAEVFVDIIPGYAIRPHTEEEMAQKLKKETKKLYDFEQTLLRYYLKYLQHLESYAGKLLKASKQSNSDVLPIICLKCLSRLLLSAPHFNYASNIITFIVHMTASNSKDAINICCSALSELFHNDLNFRISATAARSIASIVNKKKGNVPPALISTFLKLKIKEVNKGGKNHQKEKLLSKKRLLNKEKKSKSKERFAKQLKKLEADLKEAEAAESISTKLSFATETMNQVFATYFRVIKRLPTTNLLEPVLEGLAKFAHLINVEFFDDMISALSSLINQQHLRLVDSLRCIYTSFVMLSGEGIALNIDPSRFYWSMYRLLPALAFEKQQDALANTLSLTLRTLDLMINCRRKQVPVCRVAAYVKRLLALAFFMPSSAAASILLCIRSFFIAYPKLDCMVEDTDGSSYIEFFKPELDDPDCCGGLSSSIIAEISIFTRHSYKTVRMVARYLQSGLPSTGPNRLLPEYSMKKAYEWYEENKDTGEVDEEPFFMKHIIAFAKKHKLQLTSKTLHQLVCRWAEESIENKS
uniref:NOC3-like protein n=1 Tax=Elaeophora elaphi TaxID=1147741 RepID=A0A158Q8E1_9BILA